MAAGDNLKVGVDVDLEGAYQQGLQWGDNFVRGVNQKVSGANIGSQLLGSGASLAQLGPGSGLSQAVLLNQILTTLQQGFGNLIAAVGGGGAAPTGGGPTTGGGPSPGPGPKEPEGQERQSSGGSSFGRAVGAASQFPQQAYANMYQHGFYGTQVAQFAAQATSSVPIIGQFLGIVANTMQERDSALKDLIGGYRAGGQGTWGAMHDLMTGSSSTSSGQFAVSGGKTADTLLQRAQQLGIGRSEAMQLMAINSSSGDSGQGGFEALMNLQGLYGAGQQGGNLTGAMRRGGGGGGGDMDLFARVLANAVTSGLDRGRWGEAFTAMTKAANRVQGGDISRGGLLETMSLVGAMGRTDLGGSARYQGDTPAAERATQMFQGMQGGEGGGIAEVAALRAAGLGQPGVTFSEAWMRVQHGAAAGGVGLEAVLRQYMHLGAVKRYFAKPSPRNLAKATFFLSKLLPAYKPADIEQMLKTMGDSKLRLDKTAAGSMFKGLPGEGEGAQRTMKDALLTGRLHEKEEELAESDPTLQWSENAIGPRSGASYEMPETVDDLSKRGAFRKGPGVEVVDRPSTEVEGVGAEHFGETRDYWPMSKGDSQDPRYKPGWRKSRPGDPKHMARDIVVGNGQPGQKVYAPMDGVWLTNTPYKANPNEDKEGYIGEMLGDNGVRYKFMHLYFEPGLKKNSRIRAGDVIGTVAPGTKGWTPHLHLEARKKIDGKTKVIDPMSTGSMGMQEHDIMTGKIPVSRPAGGATPDAPPQFLDDAGKQIQDPDKVVPISMRGAGASGAGAVAISIELSPEAKRLLNVTVHRKPVGRQGGVG